MEFEERINHEISELKKKYESVSKKVDAIEKETKETENSIKKIENGFANMNNNFEEIMKKLDSISDDKEANKMFNNAKKNNGKFSMKGMIMRPMRKLVVGTMSTIFSVADYTSEKFSYAREGMEDMMAEAHYNSKVKKPNMMSDMATNE